MNNFIPKIVPALFPYRMGKGPEATIISKFGKWQALYFEDNRWGAHIALIRGTKDSVENKENVLLRIDSGCYTGAVLGDLQCDCVQQLHKAMRIINHKGTGLIIFIPGHEARGYGLKEKIKSFRIQEKDHVGTVTAFKKLGLNPPDIRSYEGVAHIIRRLKILSIDLLTNNPSKKNELRKYRILVKKSIPLLIRPTKLTRVHFKEKEEKLGHSGLLTKWH